MTITQLIVCIVAGLGAGLGTGLAGLSAAAVVSPMLITFLHMPAYQAIGIALASDVLASGVSAWTYKKNKNIDIRHGVIMLISVLIFTLVGSFVSSLVPNGTMGGFSKVMTLFVGLKFIIRPIMTTKEVQANKSEKQKIQQSILCGVVIGFICGFVGAGCFFTPHIMHLYGILRKIPFSLERRRELTIRLHLEITGNGACFRDSLHRKWQREFTG